MENDKKFICHRPWNMLSIRNFGHIGHCSASYSHPNRGNLFNADKRLHINKINLKQALNSDTLCRMRKQMLTGDIPPECNKCAEKENSGLESLRIQTNRDLGVNLENLKRITDTNGKVSEGPTLEHLELRLGNHCNLSCRSCSMESSIKLAPIQKKIWGNASIIDFNEEIDFENTDEHNSNYSFKNNKYNWISHQDNWKKIIDSSAHLEKIHLTGGEPFLVKEHLVLLDYLIQQKKSQHIILEYNTNLTFIPQNFFEKWRCFKEVKLGLSIDGTKDINEYIRSGIDHHTFLKNLYLLDKTNLPNLTTWFTCTLMLYNAYNLPHLYEELVSLDLKNINQHNNSNLLSVQPLRSPSFLSIYELSPTKKEKLCQYYQDYIQKLENNSNHLDRFNSSTISQLKKIINLINTINAKDGQKNWLKFLKYSEEFDQIKKTDIRLLAPELFD